MSHDLRQANMHLSNSMVAGQHVRFLDGKFIVPAGSGTDLWIGPAPFMSAFNQLATVDVAFNQGKWVYASANGDLFTGSGY